jgi:hypothetical protein
MGYFLLFESMLDTVIFARNKWLADGGSVYPDICSMYLAASGDENLYTGRLGYWDDVYGFKMSCMKCQVVKEGYVDIVNADKMLTDSCKIKVCNTCIQVSSAQCYRMNAGPYFIYHGLLSRKPCIELLVSRHQCTLPAIGTMVFYCT